MKGLNPAIAVFPGSFDPVTKGHEQLVIRALTLFRQVIIAVGTNSDKKSYFPLDKRILFLNKVFEKYENVSIETYSGLTVKFCENRNAGFIIRGLRSVSDFEFEKNIANANRQLLPGLDTCFLVTDPLYSAISSTIVRDVHRNGGAVNQFVPESILTLL